MEKRLEEEGRKESEEFISQVSQVVGISAVKYADLSQNRISNYIFSYDKMLELKGNTAPYMLYAYARTKSVGREGKIDFTQLQDAAIFLQEAEELVLAKHILGFEEVVKEVEKRITA